MTRVLTSPDAFAREALAGFADAFSSEVRLVPGGAIRAQQPAEGKVALVVGGGSGHYPAFPGFIGPGFADAAVAGDVFASPSTQQIVDVARLAYRGAGVVLGFGNYAGDVLNFGGAAKRLSEEGVPARTLAVTDDVASAPAENASARRGIAGGLVVLKIAGAAAELGGDLESVIELAERCNARTRTLGVAFSGCTLPGAASPLFTVPPGRMGLGLGIHGEPGIDEVDVVDADLLARMLVERLLEEAPDGEETRVAAVLNGLGATKYEELFVLWNRVSRRLTANGLVAVAPAVGEFYTSLDMSGCSLSLAWLDRELEPLWTASANAPAFRRGTFHGSQPVAEQVTTTPAIVDDRRRAVAASSAESRASAAVVAEVIAAIHTRLVEIEAELGRLDSFAGDGDHGRGMVRGSSAAQTAATDAVAAGAGVSSTLIAAADAWSEKAGGTSGSLWGTLLHAWARAYSDDRAAGETATAAGAAEASHAVTAAGGAQVGDKTMVDALVPFAEELERALGAGLELPAAWRSAAEVSATAAAETAELRPRVGRARPLAERSLGHPDPGAVSFAESARAAGDVLARISTRPHP